MATLFSPEDVVTCWSKCNQPALTSALLLLLVGVIALSLGRTALRMLGVRTREQLISGVSSPYTRATCDRSERVGLRVKVEIIA